MTQKQIIQELIDYAQEKMDKKEAYPFAAFIVKNGVILSRAYNRRVNLYGDKTTHSEMEAISAVNRALEHKDYVVLPPGYELYSTCEPCLACFDSSLWANVKQFVFCVDHHDFPDYFHDHHYTIEDYEKNNPKTIQVTRGVLREEGIKLFLKAKEKYGW